MSYWLPWIVGSCLSLLFIVVCARLLHDRFMEMVNDADEAPHQFYQLLSFRMFFVWSSILFFMTVGSLFEHTLRPYPKWQGWVAASAAIQFVVCSVWFFFANTRNVCEKIYVLVVVGMYVGNSYGTGEPFLFFFHLSPVPVLTFMWFFMTSSTLWVASMVALSVVTILAMDAELIPRVAEPWVDVMALRDAYELSVPVVLISVSIIFALHVRYDFYLRNTKLQTYNTLKMQVFSELAHEIKTPLNGIVGALQLVRNSPDIVHTAFLDEQLSSLNFCSSAIFILTQNVLHKEMRYKEEPKLVETDSFVNEVLTVMHHLQYLKPELELKCHIEPRVPKMVNIAMSSLAQVLLNLGSNAIKYQNKGIIRLTVDCKDNQRTLTFEFRDQGCGMSAEFMRKGLFKPYSRDARVSNKVSGSGLGLYICQKVLREIGGALFVEPNTIDGCGTIFTVDIPLKQDAQLPKRLPSLGKIPETESEAHAMKQATLRPIVVVDDTRLNLKIMQSLLRQIGAENVTCLEDGFSFLTFLVDWAHGVQDTEPESSARSLLCFIDREMPLMNGGQVIRTVRSMERELGVRVAFVGVSAGNWVAAKDGLDNFVVMQKPIKQDELRGILDAYFNDEFDL